MQYTLIVERTQAISIVFEAENEQQAMSIAEEKYNEIGDDTQMDTQNYDYALADESRRYLKEFD